MRIDESDDEQEELKSKTEKSLDQELFGDSGDDDVDEPVKDIVMDDDEDLFGQEDDDQQPAAVAVAEENIPEEEYEEDEQELKKVISVDALLPDTQGPKDNENVFAYV